MKPNDRYGLQDFHGTPASYRFVIRSYRVIDGDSVQTTLDLGFDIFTDQICRLIGVDAPEHNTTAGKLVGQVVDNWFRSSTPTVVVSITRDKFAGRYDGIIWNSGRTQTVNEYLLQEELVRQYEGEKKSRWLKRELLAIESKSKLILAGN